MEPVQTPSRYLIQLLNSISVKERLVMNLDTCPCHRTGHVEVVVSLCYRSALGNERWQLIKQNDRSLGDIRRMSMAILPLDINHKQSIPYKPELEEQQIFSTNLQPIRCAPEGNRESPIVTLLDGQRESQSFEILCTAFQCSFRQR